MTSETMPSQPQALAAQLVWVHEMLRRDLDSARRLAQEAADGLPREEVRAGLTGLESHDPLFRLRTTCLGYCQTLHGHHGGEGDALFPAVRAAAPHLAEAVDRLEAEHRTVTALLDEIEGVAADLGPAEARITLVRALGRLSVVLEDHLAYEEEVLVPVLEEWDEWPRPSRPSGVG